MQKTAWSINLWQISVNFRFQYVTNSNFREQKTAYDLLEYNHLLLLCLQCQYVVVLPDPLAARYIDGVSILIGHHRRALPQCCSNAIWQWDALGEQHNRSRVSVEVCVIAAAHWLWVKWCQAVVLQNNVGIVVIIATVSLCNAVITVTKLWYWDKSKITS